MYFLSYQWAYYFEHSNDFYRVGPDEQYRFDSIEQDSLYKQKSPWALSVQQWLPHRPPLNIHVPTAVLYIPELTQKVAKDATWSSPSVASFWTRSLNPPFLWRNLTPVSFKCWFSPAPSLHQQFMRQMCMTLQSDQGQCENWYFFCS